MSDDYEVGYGKPPRRNQFQKGKSGNPKGRPKGSKNFKTDFAEESQAKVFVVEGGVRKAVTKQRASIMGLFAKAMKGDVPAQKEVARQSNDDQGEAGGEEEARDTDDEAIVEAFAKRVAESAGTSTDQSGGDEDAGGDDDPGDDGGELPPRENRS